MPDLNRPERELETVIHHVVLSDAVAIVSALVTALANGIAVTTQHLASTSTKNHERGWQFLRYLMHHPLWLLGWGALAGSLLFQAVALHFASMSLVQPLLVVELVLALVLRRTWLRQMVSWRAWASSGATVFFLGTFLFATTRSGRSSISSLHWWAPGIWSAGLVTLLVAVGTRGSPRRRAAMWGSATAVLWALEAAFIKQCTNVISQVGYFHLLSRWPFYAFIVCGVAGLVCEQTALHVGPLKFSQTAIVIVDPVASVLLGIWIFADRLGRGWIWPSVAVMSLVLALVSAAILIAAMPQNMQESVIVPR